MIERLWRYGGVSFPRGTADRLGSILSQRHVFDLESRNISHASRVTAIHLG